MPPVAARSPPNCKEQTTAAPGSSAAGARPRVHQNPRDRVTACRACWQPGRRAYEESCGASVPERIEEKMSSSPTTPVPPPAASPVVPAATPLGQNGHRRTAPLPAAPADPAVLALV